MKQAHILLVEDNEGDIYLTREAMQESKIINTMSVVRNGSEVMPFLNKEGVYAQVETPDLILLDLNLPSRNGLEILKEIKENEHFRLIPVIMLTTSSARTDIEESYRLHANSFITKPVDADTFTTVVNSTENYWIQIVTLAKN